MKRIGLISMAVGVLLFVIAFIWTAIDPSEWDVLAPFFLGFIFFFIGLIMIIAHYILKSRTGKREQTK